MTEPFIFRYAPGPAGRPEVMYVADVRCSCGLCGHVQMQRFYHSTPFHPLRVDRLVELAAHLHQKADYACENCGESVGPEHVSHAALAYGCPDDAGVIRAFVDDPNGADPTILYELVDHRRLDPQALPGWSPRSTRGQVYPRLTDAVVERHFGRVFNPKVSWIDLFNRWDHRPGGAVATRAGPGYWLTVGSPDQLGAIEAGPIDDIDFDDFGDPDHADGPTAISLPDSSPTKLATHSFPDHIPGHWRTWLPRSSRQLLDRGGACARAYVDPRLAIEAIEYAFDEAKIDCTVHRQGADTVISEVTTPGDETYGPALSVSSVLRRAVCTGMTPGEAGRLTAEEIVGMLLRVW